MDYTNKIGSKRMGGPTQKYKFSLRIRFTVNTCRTKLLNLKSNSKRFMTHRLREIYWIIICCLFILTVLVCGMEMCCDGCTVCSGILGKRDWRGSRELSTDRPPVEGWNRCAFSRSRTARTVAGSCLRWRCCHLATFWRRSCIPCKSVWASGPARCWKPRSKYWSRRRCIRHVGSSRHCG